MKEDGIKSMSSGGSQVIGFVGLGMMGKVLAERIMQRGYQVVVFDIDATTLDAFRGKATIGISPADVADKSDIVFACLPTAKSYEQAVLDADGIASGQRVSTYVHAGTTGAPLVRKLAPVLADRGIVTVDAPVTGGVTRARVGDLTSMTSGPRDAADRVEPIIRTYSSNIVYMGGSVGGAQTMKCVNNILSAANLASACEALIVGTKAGLDPDLMLKVINAGTGQNSATSLKFPQHIVTGKFAYEGRLIHLLKDVNAFIDEAHELGVACSVSEAVQRCFVATLEQDDGRSDFEYDLTEVIIPMERAAGTAVRKIAVIAE